MLVAPRASSMMRPLARHLPMQLNAVAMNPEAMMRPSSMAPLEEPVTTTMARRAMATSSDMMEPLTKQEAGAAMAVAQMDDEMMPLDTGAS